MAHPTRPLRSADAAEPTPPAPSASLARVRVVGDLLDNALRIPGTDVRVGLDPLVGLVPGFGDLLGGLASAYIIVEAARAGAPASVLLRMLGNIGIDSVVGAFPIAGDFFDAAWKSNARNVRLFERHVEAPRTTRRASVAVVSLIVLAALFLAAGGIVLTFLLVRRLLGR